MRMRVAHMKFRFCASVNKMKNKVYPGEYGMYNVHPTSKWKLTYYHIWKD